MAPGPSIRITQVDGYRFMVDFGRQLPELLVDETPPASAGDGPCPEQMLVTSVANCLCASMVFALGKFRQDAGGVTAEASCALGRNEDGRLRIQGIEVAITLGAQAGHMDRIDRVLAQFERFCTVSESVKAGVPVSVSITDGAGARLK